MAWNKAFDPTRPWQNEPSVATPLNETNLNRRDTAINTIDDRVVSLDSRLTGIEDIEPTVLAYMQRAETGAERSEAYAIGEIAGEEVPVTDDAYHNNSKYYSELAATSETNAATSETNAATSEANAATSEANADESEENAEAWAVGQRNGADVPTTDVTYQNNSKYYSQTSQANATSATNSAERARTAATEANNSALDSEAWAVGQRNGGSVPSSDETYHNNSKYYSEQSEGSATNAATSEANAATSELNAKTSEDNAKDSETNAATSEADADQRAVDSEAWAVGKRRNEPVLPSDETYKNNAKYWAEQASAIVNVDVMVGATETTDGISGLVPQPLAGDQKKVLHGNGTFSYPEGKTWVCYVRESGQELTENWLTLSPTGGLALTPNTKDLYLVKSEGDFYNAVFSWNGTAYEMVSSGLEIDEIIENLDLVLEAGEIVDDMATDNGDEIITDLGDVLQVTGGTISETVRRFFTCAYYTARIISGESLINVASDIERRENG